MGSWPLKRVKTTFESSFSCSHLSPPRFFKELGLIKSLHSTLNKLFKKINTSKLFSIMQQRVDK